MKATVQSPLASSFVTEKSDESQLIDLRNIKLTQSSNKSQKRWALKQIEVKTFAEIDSAGRHENCLKKCRRLKVNNRKKICLKQPRLTRRFVEQLKKFLRELDKKSRHFERQSLKRLQIYCFRESIIICALKTFNCVKVRMT